MEMAVANESIHTNVADEIDWSISPMDCIWYWQLKYCYPLILDCH